MPTIKSTKVDVFMEKLMCDCGHELKFSGCSRPMSPPSYEHVCYSCGNIKWMKKLYPSVRYESISSCHDQQKTESETGQGN
jgi:hypothetical protein